MPRVRNWFIAFLKNGTNSEITRFWPRPFSGKFSVIHLSRSVVHKSNTIATLELFTSELSMVTTFVLPSRALRNPISFLPARGYSNARIHQPVWSLPACPREWLRIHFQNRLVKPLSLSLSPPLSLVDALVEKAAWDAVIVVMKTSDEKLATLRSAENNSKETTNATSS